MAYPDSQAEPVTAPPPSAQFRGRRALVTGAASGIGLAIGRHLHQLGADVVFNDLDAERLTAATAELERASCFVADLTRPDEVERLAAGAGSVEILVNNAGMQHVRPVEDFELDRWSQMLAVMLTAPFLLVKALIPEMYRRGWGRIVNIASVHGVVASPYKSAYVTAKHGLIGFTKTIALEAALHDADVTVSAICPSYVRTPLVTRQIADQAQIHGLDESEVLENVLLERNAVKRLIEPDDVARAVAFLCGAGAWAMTGSALSMDAGWLAH